MNKQDILKQIDEINQSLRETSEQRQRISNYLLRADKYSIDYMMAKDQEGSLNLYRSVLKRRRAYLALILEEV